MLQKRLSALCAFIAIAAAACGGGTSTATYPNVPISSGPAANGTFALNGPAGSKISLNIGASATVSGGTKPTLSVSASSTAPSNTTALQSVARKAPQSRLSTQSAGDTPIFYLTVSSNVAATVATIGGLGAVLASAPPSGPIYLAYYDGSQWVTIGAAATVSGDQVTFSSINFNPFLQIPAGGTLNFVVYQGVVLTTPTPEPPAPVASPTAASLYIGTTATIDVTTGPDTTISASSSNTAVATVTASVTTAGAGSTDTIAAFTVTAGSTTGNSTITFTDPLGRTATTAITVTNTPPTPVPNPAAVTIGLDDTTGYAVVVTAQPNDSISATSSDTSVATVNTPVVTNGTGQANFTVVPVAGGTTTISFTDTHGNTGTMAVTVSAVKNGAFTSGTTDWTACSYAHTALTAPINASTPTPAFGAAQTTSTAAVTSGLVPVVVGTPPSNNNPNSLGTPPPVLGNSVAIVGSLSAGSVAFPEGESGICQQVNVPATGANSADQLTFWVYEGGNEYNFKYDNQDAVILDSTGTTIKQTLFAEQNCYVNPSLGWAPGVTTSNGCWPATYGGDSGDYMNWIGGGFWSPRGPYDLSAYAGTTVTLYFGQWSKYANPVSPSDNGYAAFMFLGNVEMTAYSVFPPTAPALAHRTYGLQLKARR